MYKILLFSVLLIISSCQKKGCTDIDASNYNSEATKNDNSCQYPPAPSEASICYGYFPGNNYTYGQQIANYSLNDACTPVDYQVESVNLEKISGTNYKLIAKVDGQVSFEIVFDIESSTPWGYPNIDSKKIHFNGDNYLIYNYNSATYDTRDNGSGGLVYYITSNEHYQYLNYTIEAIFNDSSVLTTNVSNQGMTFSVLME